MSDFIRAAVFVAGALNPFRLLDSSKRIATAHPTAIAEPLEPIKDLSLPPFIHVSEGAMIASKVAKHLAAFDNLPLNSTVIGGCGIMGCGNAVKGMLADSAFAGGSNLPPTPQTSRSIPILDLS